VTGYVLVHGAWSGGNAYARLAGELRDAGHRVVVAALTGLGSRADELSPAIDLSRHIADVVKQVDAAGFDRFVLAGHSYGGMVVTGVAAKLGARIDALVYIDAFLPADGQSLWDITGEYEHRHYIDAQRDTPGLVAPLPGVSGVGVGRHPLLTLIEPVRFTGEEAKVGRRIYVFAESWQPTPFARFHATVAADPAWEVHRADASHNVMGDQPEQLLALMLSLAG
jgi:pimeloyl-ACP methyl ester carboxylesterase